MARISYKLSPRDVLFFRDARPMDVDKNRTDEVFNIGHGANWPRPDQLFSAVIHALIRNHEAPESKWYGSVNDLRVTGPYPFRNGKMYLPMPLDWDMKLHAFNREVGYTDIPEPLTAGFADRCVEKKSYPQWVALKDYERYLTGAIGKDKPDDKPDLPESSVALHQVEARVGTTLDVNTGASKRIDDRHASGQYEAEYLRLAKDVSMLCEIESEKSGEIEARDIQFGGQGGTVRCERAEDSIVGELSKLPAGEKTRFVRWTLLAPALFMNGWYPNWLNEEGKVMLPAEAVARKPGESRAEYRSRMKAQLKPFATAKLIAARIGDPVVFSGYDTQAAEKPTELAVPAGAAYVFECQDDAEAEQLFEVLNLKARSDLGEKGFGFGICSYVQEPEKFTK